MNNARRIAASRRAMGLPAAGDGIPTFLMAAILAALAPSPASAGIFPAIGADLNGPQFTITVNADNSITVTADSTAGPYNGPGTTDVYIGVVNNGTATLFSLNLTGTDIFNFDGDGIGAYSPLFHEVADPSGYAGPGTKFDITDLNTGLVLFGQDNPESGAFINDGLAIGGIAYFSLQQTPAGFPSGSEQAPEPGTLILFGLGTAGLIGGRFLRNRRH